jgi:dolichyl-diphosphooligosaccharide--protein glycosyltransferase
MSRVGTAIALIALGTAVVAVRGVGFEHVLPDDRDGVVLAVDDAQYHARRAAYTYENFPAVLSFDPYLNYPHGAYVPWPPLYDFALGAAGRLFGSLDLVLAWAPVLLGLLTAIGVCVVGWMLGGRAVAALAVAFFALLPASTRYSSVGNPDHHAAVTFVATVLLVGLLASLRAGDRPGRIWALQAVLVVARVAMLLTWHGSILYVVLPEALALIVATAFERREQLLAQSAGCGLSAILGLSALSTSHSEFGGLWSPVELSRLQPATLAAFALVALVPALLRGIGTGRRLQVTALAAAAAGGVVLTLARDSIATGWAYATRAEPFIARNFETQPLWQSDNAVGLYGYAAWLLVFTPLAGWLVARRVEVREPALAFAGWTGALLVLAVSSARYGSDFAPAASISFALLLAFTAGALTERWRAGRVALQVAVVLLIPVLMFPAIRSLWPHAVRSVAVLRGYEVVVKRPGTGFVRSVYAFVDAVREATPETGEAPAYGILTPNILGFVMNGLGDRPTPAGNFGPYVGREGLELTQRFYRATDERTAFRELQAHGIRYVVTSDAGRGAPASMLHRLHQDDGSVASGRPALGHFRLVTEGPRRGVPLGALGGAAPDFVDAPYKLFEVVAGAVLNVTGSRPGRPVFVELEVVTPIGRSFSYRASARASRQGVARVRVPYAAEAYVVRTDAGAHGVTVSEDQVASGQALDVP